MSTHDHDHDAGKGGDCCSLIHKQDWSVTELDKTVIDASIKAWLPSRIFDAHAHTWRNQDWGGPDAYRDKDGKPGALFLTAPFEGLGGWDAYTSSMVGPAGGGFGIHAGVQSSCALIPIPDAATNVDAANKYVAEQVRLDPTGRSRGRCLHRRQHLCTECSLVHGLPPFVFRLPSRTPRRPPPHTHTRAHTHMRAHTCAAFVPPDGVCR